MEKVRLATLAQNDTAGVVSRKVGIPTCETFGEGVKLVCDDNSRLLAFDIRTANPLRKRERSGIGFAYPARRSTSSYVTQGEGILAKARFPLRSTKLTCNGRLFLYF